MRKKLPRFLHRLFSPKHLQDLDVLDILEALNDPGVRKRWLYEIYQELRLMNLGVEKALLNGDRNLNDLSARRKAFQDVLEAIKTAKRAPKEINDHDPRFYSEVDLDRVTV